MDVPAPAAGTVTEVLVALNDTVREGTPIVELEPSRGGRWRSGGIAAAPRPVRAGRRSVAAAAIPAPRRGASPASPPDADTHDTQVLVIGSGPGGYTAAFRAADLGLERDAGREATSARRGLPERRLHPVEGSAARGARGRRGGGGGGLRRRSSASPRSTSTAARLEGARSSASSPAGSAGWRKQRKVKVVRGTARFTSDHTVDVDGTSIAFEHCIIAAGSRAVDASRAPRRRADRGLHRGARAGRHPGAPARDRRRDHRPRDGHGLRRARERGRPSSS